MPDFPTLSKSGMGTDPLCFKVEHYETAAHSDAALEYYCTRLMLLI